MRKLGQADQLKEVRGALKAGAEIVAVDARRRVPSKSGRARGSISTSVSGASAFVVGGRKTVRYYSWLDYGGRSPRYGQPRRVGPWAHAGRGPADGRFLRPALEAKFDEVTVEVQRGIDEVIAGEGLSG